MGKVVILDAGHGGIINGIYVTPGKRSPDWHLGVLYEGVFNRDICALIIRQLQMAGVPYYYTTQTEKDVPLVDRVKYVNEIYAKDKQAYLLSIHSNAGGGTGFEGYTSIGQTASDTLCQEFLENIKKHFPKEQHRWDYRDGDADKESQFYVLRKTNCPAMLLELLFMDNPNDYIKLFDWNVKARMAKAIAEVIISNYYAK